MDQGQTDLSGEPMQQDNLLASIPKKMLAVILKPQEFFPGMSKKGGFVEPLVFMLVMAEFTAIMLAILGIAGLGPIGMMAMGFLGMIVIPVMAAIFGFVGAAIVFVIWKMMGSNEDFECAYRCVAYSYAYAPVAALVSGVPYLGSLVSTLWPMALLAIASIHVHGRTPKLSWGVFGVLGLLFAFSSLSMEMGMRKMQSGFENWSRQTNQRSGNPDEMTPEQAGKAVAGFLKGMQKSQGK